MKNDHPQIKTLEYSYITDGIYIGTNQCCLDKLVQAILPYKGAVLNDEATQTTEVAPLSKIFGF